MRKKVAVVAMAMALCAGFVTQNVHGASCPPHNWQITGMISQYVKGSSTHRVYRNLYIDGKQVFNYCTVTYTSTNYRVFCSNCKENGTMEQITESHSLANDPDHG